MALNTGTKKILAPLLALIIPVILIQVFQVLSPLAFDPYERVDPFRYSATANEFLPRQIRNEALGMIAGIIAGIVIGLLLDPAIRPSLLYSMPLILLLLISLNGWHFFTPKEFLWLALPVWILLAWTVVRSVNYFRRKRGR